MRRLRKSLRPQNYLKSVTYSTLIVFVFRSYVDELKRRINSEWVALGQRSLNALLVSCVNVYTACVRAGREHFEHML